MMMEAPECPVCLQVYGGVGAVPRVLACGHSACEACILQLPRRVSPSLLRCPACNQLVNYPHLQGGAAALPKNVDLLRLSLAASTDATALPNPNPSRPDVTSPPQPPPPRYPVPSSWSTEFYSVWKDWILPSTAVDVPSPQSEVGFFSSQLGRLVSPCSASHSTPASSRSSCFCFRCCFTKGGESVSLVRVGLISNSGDDFVYEDAVRIVDCLSTMREEERADLGLILKACSRQLRICNCYGFWSNSEDSGVYLVCQRHCFGLLEKFDEGGYGEDEEGLTPDQMSNFANMGTEICEALISLHSEGLIAGCLGLSCFQSDDLGRTFINLNEILVAGRKVCKCMVEIAARADSSKMEEKLSEMLQSHVFVSPEVLSEILMKEGITSEELGSLRYAVSSGSDSWSLACLFISVLIRKPFLELLVDYLCKCIQPGMEDNDLDCFSLVVARVSDLLERRIGRDYLELKKILCNCLHFDPKARPLVTDVWMCIRGLLISAQCDSTSLDAAVYVKETGHCMLLGELCKLLMEVISQSGILGKDDFAGAKSEQVGKVSTKEHPLQDISAGLAKVTVLHGHLDCITGLAVGGGFLFSSSFDKAIHVWSLQNFTLVQTFRGHEHRVMAVGFVDQEEPICISGDIGGGIFVWSTHAPISKEPLRKWYEQKDWRYSGIHALTVSGSQHLFTGGGDKLIKAWSLQDYSLSCTMSGHKSVVSALSVQEGVLYSGSWDGTIRLWSLNDHSSLAVLEEDAPGNLTPVLSLTANQDILVVARENGSIKIWKNDVAMRSNQLHDGAIITVGLDGRWLFTGGMDKTLKLQELSGDGYQVDAIPIGSISYDSVITSLLYWQGKLFVGFANKLIKVHYIN